MTVGAGRAGRCLTAALMTAALFMASGCGAPTPGAVTQGGPRTSGSVTKAPPSDPSSTTSAQTSPATVPSSQVAPASVLRKALATSDLGDSYRIQADEFEDVDPGGAMSGGGLDISDYGEYVSGDKGCTALFEPHPVPVASYAFVHLFSSSAHVTEVAESYETVEDARQVMARNDEAADKCSSFTMRMTAAKVPGDTAVIQYGEISMRGDKDVEVALHTFRGRSETQVYDFRMLEERVGGEILHIRWAPGYGNDPSKAIMTRFEKVIQTYRGDHPRPSTTDSAD